MARTTIVMPDGLSKKAQDLGINISKTAAAAVTESVRKLEQKDTKDVK